MEIGSVRPAFAGPIVPTPRAPAAETPAVRTDLAGPAAVTDAQKGATVEDKTPYPGEQRAETTEQANTERQNRRDLQIGRELQSEFEIDPETNALVFKKLDIQTGDVVEQVPEEAILRMRASIAAWGSGGSQGRSGSYDIEA